MIMIVHIRDRLSVRHLRVRPVDAKVENLIAGHIRERDLDLPRVQQMTISEDTERGQITGAE